MDLVLAIGVRNRHSVSIRASMREGGYGPIMASSYKYTTPHIITRTRQIARGGHGPAKLHRINAGDCKLSPEREALLVTEFPWRIKGVFSELNHSTLGLEVEKHELDRKLGSACRGCL
jgi:hypothetical protein